MLAAALVLTTCSCGGARLAPEIDAERLAPNDGGNGYQDGIVIRNAIIVGGDPAELLEAGSSAPLRVVLINKRDAPDRLVSVSAPDAFQGAQLTGGGVDLPVRQAVGAGPEPLVTLTGATRQLRIGAFVPVEFRFQQAGATRIQVPILPPSSGRAGFSPSPHPSAPGGPSPAAPAVSPSPASPAPAGTEASPSPAPQEGGTD
ncbi:hypothetical protein GCM10010466_45260 [Planomonospora alba]|uniref:Copper chaperone PCu(A)C n=1 Tax=Planomonospora alba TaxID=161354 RepID=A0ABP6NID7_9ACTN